MSTHPDTASGISKWALPATCLFILAGLYIQAIVRGKLGMIGQDSDDVMRLLQVRDFFAGQSWFDVSQYRLGLEGGTAMHWSRIVDIPLIALTWMFDLFMPYEHAEKWAISVWPPLLSVAFVLGMWTALKSVKGPYTKAFGLVLLACIYVRFYRFYPGAIDHHNLQLVSLAFAIGFAIDPLRRFRSYALAGIACALSIAIGMEVYVFIAVICVFIALNWAISGANAKRGTIGFGAGLGLTLAVIYVLTIAPSAYGETHCDTFSLIYLLAGSLGGFGIAALAATLSTKPLAWRLVGLVVLGFVCAVLVLTVAPQCLSNPLSSLPPSVKTLWLDEVLEAQSMAAKWAKSPDEVAFMMPIQIIAFCVTSWLLKRGEDRRIFGLFLALIITGLVMSLYQSRFYVFGFLFAIVPLARWIGLTYEKKKTAGSETSVAYILALACSLPYVWVFPFIVMDKAGPDMSEDLSVKCYAESVYEAFNELPKGVLLATSNGGPDIIDKTEHRALNGNYHRNVEGIKASIDIFISPPKKSGVLLKKYNVDYLHFCRTTRETTSLTDYSPDGLFASLANGDVPNYLGPIGPDLEDGSVTIYKVINPQE